MLRGLTVEARGRAGCSGPRREGWSRSRRLGRSLAAPTPKGPPGLLTSVTTASAMKHGGPEFLEQPLVQKEWRRLLLEQKLVPGTLELLKRADVPGKRRLLEKLEAHSERWEIFFARLRLSGSPEAMQFVHMLRSLWSTLGSVDAERFNPLWECDYQKRREYYATLRRLVDMEEELAGHPHALEWIREGQAAWIEGRYQAWADLMNNGPS